MISQSFVKMAHLQDWWVCCHRKDSHNPQISTAQVEICHALVPQSQSYEDYLGLFDLRESQVYGNATSSAISWSLNSRQASFWQHVHCWTGLGLSGYSGSQSFMVLGMWYFRTDQQPCWFSLIQNAPKPYGWLILSHSDYMILAYATQWPKLRLSLPYGPKRYVNIQLPKQNC